MWPVSPVRSKPCFGRHKKWIAIENTTPSVAATTAYRGALELAPRQLSIWVNLGNAPTCSPRHTPADVMSNLPRRNSLPFPSRPYLPKQQPFELRQDSGYTGAQHIHVLDGSLTN